MAVRLSNAGRRDLQRKLAVALSGKIKDLSDELQEILLDDLVTAFENRLCVLSRLKC